MDDRSVTLSVSDESAIISEVTPIDADVSRDVPSGAGGGVDLSDSVDSIPSLNDITALLEWMVCEVERSALANDSRVAEPSVIEQNDDAIVDEVASLLQDMVTSVEQNEQAGNFAPVPFVGAPQALALPDVAAQSAEDEEVTRIVADVLRSLVSRVELDSPRSTSSPSRFKAARSQAHASDSDLDAAEERLNSPRSPAAVSASAVTAAAQRRETVLSKWGGLSLADQWRLKSSWQLDSVFRSLQADCERCLGTELQNITPSYVWDWFFDQSRALDDGISPLREASSKDMSAGSSSFNAMASSAGSNHLDGNVNRLMEWTLMITELLENAVNASNSSLDAAVRQRLAEVQQLLNGLSSDLEVLQTLDAMVEVVHSVNHVTETVCTDYDIEQEVIALLDQMTAVVEVTHDLVDRVEQMDAALFGLGDQNPLAATAARAIDTLSVSAASTTVADGGEHSPLSEADKTAPDRTNSGIRAELKSQSDHALQNDLQLTKESDVAAENPDAKHGATASGLHDGHSQGWCQGCTRRPSKPQAEHRGVCASSETCILC